MRKNVSASQRAISVSRGRIRYDIEKLALTHRGCVTARGCGCYVDQALTILQRAEAQLFAVEIDSYANPGSPRRIVQPDNTIGESEPADVELENVAEGQ